MKELSERAALRRQVEASFAAEQEQKGVETPEELALRTEEIMLVRKAVDAAGLTTEEREAVMLYTLGDREPSLDEVSEAMGIGRGKLRERRIMGERKVRNYLVNTYPEMYARFKAQYDRLDKERPRADGESWFPKYLLKKTNSPT